MVQVSETSSLTCSFCEGVAVYRRSYSGEALCSSCFKRSIVEKTRRTISRYSLLRHGEKIAVAVSGGKDSTSLLHVLGQIAREHGSELYAVTVDEGVAGYRDESRALAEKTCRDLGVPQVVVSFEELFGFTLDRALSVKDRKVTSCTLCGTLRRRAIDVAAQKIEADVVATAHNLDDFLQTFFINLMNNDLQRAVWANPLAQQEKQQGLRRVKPFMEIPEVEIAFYAYLAGIDFQSAECPYNNESVRSELRVFFDKLEAGHPGVKFSLAKSFLQLTSTTPDPSSKIRQMCQRCGQLSSQPICSVCKTLQVVSAYKQIYDKEY